MSFRFVNEFQTSKIIFNIHYKTNSVFLLLLLSVQLLHKLIGLAIGFEKESLPKPNELNIDEN